MSQFEIAVPAKNPLYVKDQFFGDLIKIFEADMFYPAFVTGLSGNGKTEGVMQACAAANRQMVRVNFTIETDENDLIGGFRLINGETVFEKGPVLKAMEAGAVLLLDEIDLASPSKVMCLQSIMEGAPYFVKKTSELIVPKKGFNIVATANTKGKGSMDGRFVGTNILNEAFLERFPVTFEQEYPTPQKETKILQNFATSLNLMVKEDGLEDKTNAYIDVLVKWAAHIRNAFAKDASDEVISTRRLINIIRAFSIFKDEKKAMNLCLSRFDAATKKGFIEQFNKMIPVTKVAGASTKDADVKEFNSPEDVVDFLAKLRNNP